MGLPAKQRLTTAQYLSLEEASAERHELIDGQMIAMAGGTLEHARRVMALTALLLPQLRGRPCQLYGSEARVYIAATGLHTYPDLSLVCGRPLTDPVDPEALTNPALLAEVLSPSTERYDRGEKFHHYARLPSLRHYLLLAQDRPAIEHFHRQGERWLYQLLGPGQRLSLPDLGLDLDLDALFPPDPPAEPEAAQP